MRKHFGPVAVAAIVAALFVVQPALAGSPDNDYQGRAEHDTGTYFGFDIKKSGEKTQIARVAALLKYHCSDGGGETSFGAFAKGRLRVKADRTFGGKLDVPIQVKGGGISHFTYTVKGKLGKKGKASGTIDAGFRFENTGMRGTASGHCYSGVLHWKAKKGAHVSLPEGRAIAGGRR